MKKTYVVSKSLVIGLLCLVPSGVAAQDPLPTQIFGQVAGQVLMDTVGFTEAEKAAIRSYYWGRGRTDRDSRSDRARSGEYDRDWSGEDSSRYRYGGDDRDRHDGEGRDRDREWRESEGFDDRDWDDKKRGRKKDGKDKKKKKDLPPGLARKGELPPGLQRQLERDGTLPPGLSKRRLPDDLERRLPRRSDSVERVMVGEDVLLIETVTGRILDILHGNTDGR